ncbi:MAG: hypothetical protein WBV82_23345 [Myxococcaceae bacterium]
MIPPNRQRPQGPRLKYGEARSSIRTGDVLLFQGTTFVSRFIRWGSNSPYSHAGIALWAHERLMVVQSASRGVEILPASTAVKKYDGQVDWWQPAGAAREQLRLPALVDAAFDELGKPFAVRPLLALVARMFRRKDHGNPDLTGRAPGYFCSQLVSRCYRRGGVDLVPGKADHDTSPGDLSRSDLLVFSGVLHHHPGGVPAVPRLPSRADAPDPRSFRQGGSNSGNPAGGRASQLVSVQGISLGQAECTVG